MIKRVLLVGLIVASVMMLSVSVALAAQGQITEVNPSGIGKALAASDGRVGEALQNTPAAPLLPSDSFGESPTAGGTP